MRNMSTQSPTASKGWIVEDLMPAPLIVVEGLKVRKWSVDVLLIR